MAIPPERTLIGAASVRGAEVPQEPPSAYFGQLPASRFYSAPLPEIAHLLGRWPEWSRCDTETLCRWVDVGFLKIIQRQMWLADDDPT